MNLEQNSRDSRHFKYLSPDSECSRIPRSLALYSGPRENVLKKSGKTYETTEKKFS